MKKIGILLVLLSVVWVYAVTFINPYGPTIFAVAGLLDKQVKTDMALETKFWKTMDEATAYIVAKKVNFAALPVVFGANLYTQGVDVRLVGVYSWRLLFGHNTRFRLQEYTELERREDLHGTR